MLSSSRHVVRLTGHSLHQPENTNNQTQSKSVRAASGFGLQVPAQLRHRDQLQQHLRPISRFLASDIFSASADNISGFHTPRVRCSAPQQPMCCTYTPTCLPTYPYLPACLPAYLRTYLHTYIHGYINMYLVHREKQRGRASESIDDILPQHAPTTKTAQIIDNAHEPDITT